MQESEQKNHDSSIFYTDTRVRKTAVTSRIISKVAEHLSENARYYSDAIKYNCNGNGTKNSSGGTEKILSAGHLPKKAREKVHSVYSKYNYDAKKIGKKLNIPEGSSMLEYKYVYEYLKKYGTYKYSDSSYIGRTELMRRLSDTEAAEFRKMF
jgi:hypothetical protein